MDWLNLSMSLLGMIVLGFAIYGIDLWYEKSKGYLIDLRDYEDLDELWDYCDRKFLRSHIELYRNKQLEWIVKDSFLFIAIDRLKNELESSEYNKEIDDKIIEHLRMNIISLQQAGKLSKNLKF